MTPQSAQDVLIKAMQSEGDRPANLLNALKSIVGTEERNSVIALEALARVLEKKGELKYPTPEAIEVEYETSNGRNYQTVSLSEDEKNQYAALRESNRKHNQNREVILNQILDNPDLSWFLAAASAHVRDVEVYRAIQLLLLDLRARKNSRGVRQFNEDLKEIAVNYPDSSNSMAKYLTILHVHNVDYYERQMFYPSSSPRADSGAVNVPKVGNYQFKTVHSRRPKATSLPKTADVIKASITSNDIGDCVDLPSLEDRNNKTTWVDKNYPENSEALRQFAENLRAHTRDLKKILSQMIDETISVNNFTIFLQRLQPLIQNDENAKINLLKTINVVLAETPLKSREAPGEKITKPNGQMERLNKSRDRVLKQFVRNTELMWLLGVNAASIASEQGQQKIMFVPKGGTGALVKMRGLSNDNGIRAWNECLKYMKRQLQSISPEDSQESLIDKLISTARSTRLYTPWTKTQRQLWVEKMYHAAFSCSGSKHSSQYQQVDQRTSNVGLNALQVPPQITNQLKTQTYAKATAQLFGSCLKRTEEVPKYSVSQFLKR